MLHLISESGPWRRTAYTQLNAGEDTSAGAALAKVAAEDAAAAVGLDVDGGGAGGFLSPSVSLLVVVEIILGYLQNLGSFLVIPALPAAWKLGVGWVGVGRCRLTLSNPR